MSPAPVNFGANPLPPLGNGAALKQFMTNSGKILRNYGQNMVQDPETLKRNSLIISTLVLVLSRIGISNASAIQAKGTTDESHRRKEAIKTTMRELGGWTLGYIVFRGIQNATKGYLHRALNFETNRKSSVMIMARNLKAEAQKALSKTPGQIENLPVKMRDEFKPVVRGTQQRLDDKSAQAALNNWRIPEPVKKLCDRLWKTDSAFNKLRKIYAWLPLVVGGIPAVFLSGYVLEKFTQNHSQQLAEALSAKKDRTMLKRLDKIEEKAGDHSPSCNIQAFNAYFDQVHTRRTERGIVFADPQG